MKVSMMMQQYSKAIAAFVASAVSLIAALAANGVVSDQVAQIVAACVPLLTALGVYVAPANQ